MFQSVHIFLKKTITTQVLLSFWLFAFGLGACDNLKFDEASQAPVENPNNVFYTTTEAITINPTSLQGLENASQVSILREPMYGEAKFTDNGLVYYKLTSTSSVNRDNLVLRGKTSAGATIDKQVEIMILPSIQDLPCYAGAIGDRAEVEVSTPISLNVTANDKTCTTIGGVQIEVQPKHGIVSVQGQSIIYIPEKDYIGSDMFLYRINISNNKNPVAPVELAIVEPAACATGLKDDDLSITNYVEGSNIAIDILKNDVICSLYSKARLRIVLPPQHGKVSIDSTSFDTPIILYQADKGFKGDDTFSYGLYRNQTDFVKAKVSVSIK